MHSAASKCRICPCCMRCCVIQVSLLPCWFRLFAELHLRLAGVWLRRHVLSANEYGLSYMTSSSPRKSSHGTSFFRFGSISPFSVRYSRRLYMSNSPFSMCVYNIVPNCIYSDIPFFASRISMYPWINRGNLNIKIRSKCFVHNYTWFQ